MTHSLESLREIYNLPITTLIFRAQQAHHAHQDPAGVQLSMLESIKTGACPEDCAYCPQSCRSKTGVQPAPLMKTEAIVASARRAKAAGAGRFCMGAAWRQVQDGAQFDSVLDTVRGVSALGLEVCCTLGLMRADQLRRLKDAGCAIYNHNLDTSREYYSEIIHTRTYDDRLQTIRNVREAGLKVCSGGIIGMGESIDDRLKMILEFTRMDPPPESVPINALIAIKGTPLEDRPQVDPIEFVRVIATARIALPASMIRLSAGRADMSLEMQTLCFLAGANGLFLGDKLLTAPNAKANDDFAMLEKLGLHSHATPPHDDLETECEKSDGSLGGDVYARPCKDEPARLAR